MTMCESKFNSLQSTNDLEIQGLKKSQKDTQGMEYERHYQN